MWLQEEVAALIVRQRIEEAVQAAERARAEREVSTATPRSVRVRVGTALVRVGHWMIGGAGRDCTAGIETGGAHP